MAIGESGRVVLEIRPELKRRLYSTLALDDKTLKEWFISVAERYIDEYQQPGLFPSPSEQKYR
jgi:hypothetical protein